MEQEKANVDHLMLEKKAIARLDRILKKDANALSPGAAYYNNQKKRVEENVIQLSELYNHADKGIFYGQPFKEPGKDCLVLERLAWAREEKQAVLVGVAVCE
jgi:hypothetical protein